MSGNLFTFILIVLCGHIGLIWTQDYNYDDYYGDNGCGWTDHFCTSTNRCINASEACDGQCGRGYHFCLSNGSCFQDSEACDGQCGGFYHFCPSSDDCIDKFTPCDGNCPDDRPNLCDNGTLCYPDSWINNLAYQCADRSDEHRHTEEPPPLDNSSVDKFLQLNTGEDEDGDAGVDCQDGTLHLYYLWCIKETSRMCGGVSTNDYFICHNSSLWRDRPCREGSVRGCKVPGKCIDEGGKCNGHVENRFDKCGASDYSTEVCPLNGNKLKEHSTYFRCKDNSSLIHPTLVCDGHLHCDDSSDENDCDTCPRVNNMVVHGQVVQLKDDETRNLPHLRSTAIMRVCMLSSKTS